jgi:hypothetical protein
MYIKEMIQCEFRKIVIVNFNDTRISQLQKILIIMQ